MQVGLTAVLLMLKSAGRLRVQAAAEGTARSSTAAAGGSCWAGSGSASSAAVPVGDS